MSRRSRPPLRYSYSHEIRTLPVCRRATVVMYIRSRDQHDVHAAWGAAPRGIFRATASKVLQLVSLGVARADARALARPDASTLPHCAGGGGGAPSAVASVAAARTGIPALISGPA